MSIVRALIRGGERNDAMLVCAGCATPFRPARTRGECPVCGWRDQSRALRPSARWVDEIDVAVVVAVTGINLLLLLLLVLVVQRQ